MACHKTKGIRLLTLLIVFIMPPTYLMGQDDNQQEKEEKKTTRAARKQYKIDHGKWMVMPLAGPAYTPEMGGVLAAGIMTSFKTNPDDSLIQRSSLPIMFGGSTTGAVFFSSVLSSYWLEDKMRIYGDFWFKDMPDNYWGVGYQSGRDTPKGDSTTAYQRAWYWINPRILWQFEPRKFVGLNIDVNNTAATDVNPLMAEDETFLKYGEENFNVGFGAILRYDSRDIPVNAWGGTYFDFMATVYSKAFGGDNDYQVYMADFRKYFRIKREGRTLAWQVKGRFGVNDVPYAEMSQLGTPFDLRGYTWGRYRDNSMIFSILEYRHMFAKRNGDVSPHGVVLWAGTGSIASNARDFEYWLPNFGFGYRFEVQPRMNLRLDYGFGLETTGFYFNFNEAF